jgi:hypothetical protein
MFRILAALLLSLGPCSLASAQSGQLQTFHLVLPTGPGLIVVSSTPEWRPSKLMLLDQGARASLQLDAVARKSASFLLYHAHPQPPRPSNAARMSSARCSSASPRS